MMDFNFRDGTEAKTLGILGIGRRAAMMDFNFGEGTDANALRLLRIRLGGGEQMREQKPVPPPPWGSSTLPLTRVQWSPSLHTTHALQIQMGTCMHLFIGPGKSD